MGHSADRDTSSALPSADPFLKTLQRAEQVRLDAQRHRCDEPCAPRPAMALWQLGDICCDLARQHIRPPDHSPISGAPGEQGTEIVVLNFRFVASAEIPPDCLARGGRGPGVNLASAGVFFIAWFQQQLGQLGDASRDLPRLILGHEMRRRASARFGFEVDISGGKSVGRRGQFRRFRDIPRRTRMAGSGARAWR